jgi:cell wall-associated NlpC family hydrolase
MAPLGQPYVYGGSGPGGFDCSGLTSWAWRAAGVSLPRTAQAQYNAVRHIPISALQPGDLVFYGSAGGIYHVGIYVGGGRMIHAPHSGQVVSYISINFSGLLGGGRVV